MSDPLSLAELIAAEKKQPGTECTIAKIMRELTPDDAAVLKAAIADKDVASNQLERALKRAGHTVGRETIQRHRRADCTCDAR